MSTIPTPSHSTVVDSTGAAVLQQDAALASGERLLQLLDNALHALRTGSFDDLVRQRPRLVRWLLRRHGPIVLGTLGDSVTAEALPQVAAVLLRWLVVQLRPDAVNGFDQVPEDAWVRLPAWRPFLAVASSSGLLRIPDLPRVYRRHADEAPLDNLCGLWDVGPSTVYRLLERARRLMLQAWATELDALRCLSLRELVRSDIAGRGIWADDIRRCAWHVRQAQALGERHDAPSALWHCWQADDVGGFVHTLRQYAGPLAGAVETDSLVRRVDAQSLTPRQRVDLWLARAALERTRESADRELAACQQARQVAQAAQDRLLLGIVHSALGRYYDSRDPDRSLACYQDSAEFLGEQGPASGDVDAQGHFMTTFVRLAWLYLRRNDPRSKAVLDRAELLRGAPAVNDDALGMLEQAWGEYWHRAGDRQRSLEHRFRALNIFERTGDDRSVHAARVSIAHDLAARGDHDRAQQFLRETLLAAEQGRVEPEIAVSAHLNLGAILFHARDLAAAIAHYDSALSQALKFGLRLHAFNTRYNLAEALYQRFRDRQDPADELAADAHVRDAVAAAGSEISPATLELIRNLKSEVLVAGTIAEPNRLLPGEVAVHFDEMSEVHRQRQALSLPADPHSHARAHLAIARAYLAISTKEREAARALIDKHGLQARFTAELEDLQQTFNRELTREQQVAVEWKRVAADVVPDESRPALVAHLMRAGAINKSAYVELCGVAPATASKHLGLLTERGLLVQSGKGPSTRYSLPR